MNNTTDDSYGLLWVANAVGFWIHLPPNIYILHLILSRNMIIAEFFPFHMALSEIFISLHDGINVASVFFKSPSIVVAERFFLAFIVTSRPLLLMLICVERYLAVAKPVFFIKFKFLRYKLLLSGVVWLLTILSGLGIVFFSQIFYFIVTAEIIAICAIKLHCCIATLCILKRPGPGEKVESRNKMNNVKLKAFKIIFVITLSVILTYFPLICILLLTSQLSAFMLFNIQNVCCLCTANTGLVQSLLFLYRFEKLPFAKFGKCL